MLLTRLPLGIATSFDLHVLGTPPALVLSQDQTLHKKSLWSLEPALMEAPILLTSLSPRYSFTVVNFARSLLELK